MRERLPSAPGEARVRGQRDWDVDVEDLLREALVGIDGRVEEDQRERGAHQDDGRGRERGERDMTQAEKHETAAMIAERSSPASG